MKLIKTMIFIFFLSTPLIAEPLFEAIELRTNMLFIINTDELNSAPSPMLFSPGLSFPLKFLPFLVFAPSIDLYATHYDLVLNRALPIEYEHRLGYVVGLMFDFPLYYTFSPTPIIELGAGLDLLFHARIAVAAASVPPEEASKIDGLNSYFWGMGRFFMPGIIGNMKYSLSDTLKLSVNIRVLFPIFHAWDGENLPFADEMILSSGLGIIIKL